MRRHYVFGMFLPGPDGSGIPEASRGGSGKSRPGANRAEEFWCCYAWPAHESDRHRNRTFFINQDFVNHGDILQAEDDDPRYLDTRRMPDYAAAFRRGNRMGMAGAVAASSIGGDGEHWTGLGYR
jgi:hypothetical protein